MRIGVLAVQGAFAEHIAMLQKLDAEPFEIRQKRDLEQPFDGLILPGGESTTMANSCGNWTFWKICECGCPGASSPGHLRWPDSLGGEDCQRCTHLFWNAAGHGAAEFLWETARGAFKNSGYKGDSARFLWSLSVRPPSKRWARAWKSWRRSMAKPLACGMGIKSGWRSILN